MNQSTGRCELRRCWDFLEGHNRDNALTHFEIGTPQRGARLVRHLNGRHELIGGTPDDLVAVREWCSMFAHDLVFSRGRRVARSRSFAS